MISVKGLNVSYYSNGNKVPAVKDVSFEIAAGESFGLVGESGSGKSTILRALIGLVENWSGDVTINGMPITAQRRSKSFCKLVQMIFQDPYASLHPRHTIHHALTEPLSIHGMNKNNSGNVEQKITDSLKAVGLDPAMRFRYPHQLSGGQRQRVAIARALMLQPSILLLDEPTSALDVSVQAEILTLFERLRREFELTMILVTHNLAVVAKLCDRIAVMRNGRIEEVVTADQLRAGQTAHPYTTQLLAASHSFQNAAGSPRSVQA